MASPDPFAPIRQEEEADPFAPLPTAQPVEATGLDPLMPVESADESLDTRAPSAFDVLMQMQGGRPSLPMPAPMEGQEAAEKMQRFQQGIIDLGQKLRTGLEEHPSEVTLIPGLSGHRAALLLEEGARVPSSIMEQVGTIYSDLTDTSLENNIPYIFGRTLREATRTPDEELAQEGFAEQFERGIAQTAGFLGGGAIAKTPKMAAAVAAWLGSAVGGQAGREDALRHGAEEWQVDVAYWLNSLFGATEGLPIGLALNRLDDMTGGVFSKKVKSTAGKLTIKGIQGAIEEGLQETAQSFGENWTAADVAAYDPARPLSANLKEAATIGGSIGAMMSMAMSFFGIKSRQRFEQRIQDEVLTPLGLNSLDEIAGPFSLIGEEYARIQKEIGETERVIEERAAVGDTGEARTNAAIDRENLDEEAFRPIPRTSKEGQIDRSSRSAIILNSPLNVELEGDKPLVIRIKETPVVMGLVQVQKANEQASKNLEQQIQVVKQRIKERGETKNETEGLRILENKHQQIKALIKEEKQLAKSLKSLAASLRQFLPKDAKLFITNQHSNGGNENGFYARIAMNRGEKDSEAIDVISLDTDQLMATVAQAAEAPEGSVIHSVVQQKRAQILAVFLHEFGHAHGFHQFQELYFRIVRGEATDKEKTTWRALQNDYKRHVAEALDATAAEAVSTLFSLPRAAGLLEAVGIQTKFSNLQKTVENLTDDDNMDAVLLSSFPNRVGRNFAEYALGMEEYFAEEFSKIALGMETGVDPAAQEYFKEGVAVMRKALELAKGKFRTTSPTQEAFFKGHSLRRQLAAAIEEIQKSTEQSPLMALAKDGIVDVETMHRLGAETDRFNKLMDIGFNILQIAEQNPHIIGLQNYVKHLREWKNEVNNNLAIAEDRLAEWKNLGTEETEKLGRLLLDETMGRKPDGGWLKEPRNFTVEEIAKYGLSEAALELRGKIKEDFQRVLSEMEAVLVDAKLHIYADDPATAGREILKVKQEFANLRKKPYFPLMRFGEFTYEVRSVGEQVIDGKRYGDGALVEFQSFDTKPERNKAEKRARKEFVSSKVSVSKSKMVQPNFSLQGMPLTLLEHLESKLVSAGLNDEVRDAIKAVKNDTLPFKSFRKQFQRRKRVEGYSLDAQRSYANYMVSFSNHIARVKFDRQFKADFDNIGASIKSINRREGGDSTKRASILNHMNDHLQYVMNPVNEFVGLRSAAFFWFLGFNVKSAFVNLTQIPLVTYPYLAARFGDGKAVAALSRANGTAIKALTKPDSVDPEILQMLEQGMKENWLDQSLATELALAASEKNLDKSLPRKFRQKATLKISHYGAMAFHVVEKFNRHVTAIAAYRLARGKGAAHEQGIEAARRAVEKTQFEYARWARPRFMRGKLGGTVFVFQNYMQNALYFALGGDPGALRMLVMLFLVAGLQGLPFGENLADLTDAAMTSLKRRTGMKDPHTQVRVELRALIKELEINPDLILHGLSSQTFGLSQIGEFMGWPIPAVDLSGSLSMGRIIPGTEMLQPGKEKTFERVAAEGLERGGGAAISGIAGIGQALLNAHPDQWKRWEKAMPAVMRQISKGARYMVRGEEATRSDYPIAGFDMHDPRDQAEAIAQMLGFTPRDVSKGWEGFIAKQQSILYYESWKTGLLRHWNYAKETSDEEAVKQANADIREYNSIVPFPEMKIGFKTRRASYLSYLGSRKYNKAQIEQAKSFRRLADSVEEVFEDAEPQ